MAVHIPAAVAESSATYDRLLVENDWRLFHEGKVRRTYRHPEHPSQMLVVATDQISVFDRVLPCEVPQKGEVLTALTHFWMTQVLADVPNHLVLDSPIGLDFLPSEFRGCCQLVRVCDVAPYELIFRGHLGGSVWKGYEESGIVTGVRLLPGLQRWQNLGVPLFTPSTKAMDGEHDENIAAGRFFNETDELGRQAVQRLQDAYVRAYSYACKRGVIILDSKFEVQLYPFCLCDEVLTPDSSRFTTIEDLERALREGRDPVFYDKQPVRDWAAARGFKGLSLDEIDALVVPDVVIGDATERYLRIFEMLTGTDLATYQREKMGLAA